MAFGTNDELVFGADDEEIPEDSGGFYAKEPGGLGKKLLGAGETALSFGTGMLAQIPAGVGAVLSGLNEVTQGKRPDGAEKMFSDIQSALTYEPRSVLGKDYTEDLGKSGFMQSLNAVGAVAHTMPPVRTAPAIPRAVGMEIPLPKSAMDTVPVPETPTNKNPYFSVDKDGNVLDLSIDQANIDQQGMFNRTPNAFNPARRNGEANAVDHSNQLELPFQEGPEAIKAAQERTSPQQDMFIRQEAQDRAFDPFIENQKAEITKRQQMEDLFAEKEKTKTLQEDVMRLKQKFESPARMGGLGRSQRGAINIPEIEAAGKYLREGFISARDFVQAWKGAFDAREMTEMTKAIDNPNSRDTMVLMSPDEFLSMAKPRDKQWMEKWAPEKHFSIKVALQGEKGLREVPYLHVETGADGVAKVVGHEGRHRMDVFKEKGLDLIPVRVRDANIRWGENDAWPTKMRPEGLDTFHQLDRTFPEPLTAKPNTGVTGVGRSQRGGVTPNMLTFGLAGKIADMRAGKQAQDKLTRTNKAASVMKASLGTDEGFRADIRTPEDVIAAAPEAKDISTFRRLRGTSVTAGINRIAGATNNPLIKFVRDSVRTGMREAENLARVHITDKGGLGGMWEQLNQKERNGVMTAWKFGDEQQAWLTPEQMTEAGLNGNQVAALSKIYEMQHILFERTNEAYNAVGLKPIKERPGHFPGLFTGDYSSIVFVPKKDANGRPMLDKNDKAIMSPIGRFAADTAIQHKMLSKKVAEALKAKYPDAIAEQLPRQSLGKKGQRITMLGDVGKMMELMGKNDASFAEVQKLIQEQAAQVGSTLYGANLHALEKKGIWGNEGNKFWKDVDANTNEAFKAYLQYFEETAASHNMLKTEVEARGLLANPALDGMPNAKKYSDTYLRHATGRSLGETGDALNTLLDYPAREIFGVGPSWERATVNQITKRMGQHTMGWFNLPFMAMQLLQVPQTAFPEFLGLTRNAELNGLQGARAFTQAAGDAIALFKHRLKGTETVDPLQTEMFKYAHENGLLNFSEFADINKITQTKAQRVYDATADFTRTAGELTTRPLVFFTFVRMLEESGKLSRREVLDMAYNKTQYAMVDYTAPERPMMYTQLGEVGKTAGGLKTFMHSFLGQQGDWFRRAKQGDISPLLTGLTMASLATGITGLPLYSEIDDMYGWLTNKLGKRQTIRETALKNMYTWAQDGVLSDTMNINVQGRLGMADLVPTLGPDLISPYASTMGKMGSTAVDLLIDPNPTTGRNAALAWAPSSLRGPLENVLSKDEKTGASLDKEERLDYPRTERDWKLRQFGLTSMEESKNKSKLWTDTLSKMSDDEAQTKILTKMKIGFRRDQRFGVSPEFAELLQKYKERNGDPSTLESIIQRDLEQAKQLKKQRLQGIPSGSADSINRYKAYQ